MEAHRLTDGQRDILREQEDDVRGLELVGWQGRWTAAKVWKLIWRFGLIPPTTRYGFRSACSLAASEANFRILTADRMPEKLFWHRVERLLRQHS